MAQFVKQGIGYKRVFTEAELRNFELKKQTRALLNENELLQMRLDALEGLLCDTLGIDIECDEVVDNQIVEEANNEESE